MVNNRNMATEFPLAKGKEELQEKFRSNGIEFSEIWSDDTYGDGIEATAGGGSDTTAGGGVTIRGDNERFYTDPGDER